MEIKCVYNDISGYTVWYRHDSKSDVAISFNAFELLYLHRTDGPAYISDRGYVEFWLHNKRRTGVRYYCELCGFSDEETVIWLLKYGDNLPTRIDQL